ncbi:MAG: glycosyltransferase [bacterium]|nr:glycosyltransferase [bacterium]
MNKHIAIISFHTCPLASQEGKESGGMNVYVLEIARSLVTHGYKVDIFTRIQDVISPEIVDYEPNLRVIHLKAGPKRHIDKKKLIFFIDEFTSQLHLYITKNSLDYSIFDCHYYLSGMVAYTYNKKYQTLIPYTVNFHTLA